MKHRLPGGVPRDLQKAVELLTQAAGMGQADAPQDLAALYREQGNAAEAQRWEAIAARRAK